jgi:hypothetical protein
MSKRIAIPRTMPAGRDVARAMTLSVVGLLLAAGAASMALIPNQTFERLIHFIGM